MAALCSRRSLPLKPYELNSHIGRYARFQSHFFVSAQLAFVWQISKVIFCETDKEIRMQELIIAIQPILFGDPKDKFS